MKKALCSKLAASLLLTAGLFAASAPASADTTSLIFDADHNAGFYITHIPGASFVDDFLFSVDTIPHYPSGTVVVGKTWVDGTRLANYGIDSIEFFHVDTGGGYTILPTTVTSGLLEFYPVGALGAGSYGFRVTGHTLLTDMGGAYAGTLNLAPVPEPAAYLMLLIGVGLLAFTSKAKENDKLG
ncbi:FxDxF family PEP-CTERM protein [Massilia sp. BJB1822]|uniref:FxDxF family PEP-CTERM protein n=1 Tax=Massilia sp. BJB1822 TaxID=2744470 RepID=UPI001592D381|nr:FxDxF family PEP-CTERM protein [Massilia sp. BJB1822]NVE00269.1 PEP-CTERM sorting domain-containing protein [Massilia sp. BJB1822]